MEQNKTSVRAVVLLGTSFCFVFLSFSACQNYQTGADHASERSTSVGVLYAMFTVTNFFAATVVGYLGSRLSLMLAAMTYVSFVAANIEYNEWALYVISAWLGIGAAVVWCAQGAYVTRATTYHESVNNLPLKSQMGYFNGLFWAIFQVNQLVGNLIVGILFQYGVDAWKIFTVLTVVATFGVFLMFFLKPIPEVTHKSSMADHSSALLTSQQQDSSYDPNDVSSSETGYVAHNDNDGSGSGGAAETHSKVMVMESLRQLGDHKLQILIPVMIFSGLSQTLFYGDFTGMMHSNSTKFFVMAAAGAMDSFTSFAAGRLSDRIGRLPIFLTGMACFAVACIVMLLTSLDDSNQPTNKGAFYALGLVLAVGDGCVMTQLYAVLGTFFSSNAELVFGNFKLFQAGSTAAAFLYHPHLTTNERLAIVLTFLVLATVCMVYTHFRLWRLEDGKSRREENGDASGSG